MRSLKRNSGFTYLALLFFVAVTGALAASVGVIWSTESQRNKEQQLLYVGGQYRQAIRSYFEKTPGTVKRYPQDFKELLKDSRQAGTVRHLRRQFRDPMTDSAEWGIVRAPDGGIMGIYSLSNKEPIKSANLSSQSGEIVQGRTYKDWRFVFIPVGR
jgi:type II secretory pathway pseudopilin PulG